VFSTLGPLDSDTERHPEVTIFAKGLFCRAFCRVVPVPQ
jgi:hypothetical protein